MTCDYSNLTIRSAKKGKEKKRTGDNLTDLHSIIGIEYTPQFANIKMIAFLKEITFKILNI